MQIQLSTHQFRIFYGESFGSIMTDVINAISDYEINFHLNWFDDFCVITLDKLSKKEWNGILECLFDSLCDGD